MVVFTEILSSMIVSFIVGRCAAATAIKAMDRACKEALEDMYKTCQGSIEQMKAQTEEALNRTNKR